MSSVIFTTALSNTRSGMILAAGPSQNTHLESFQTVYLKVQ